MPDKKITHGEGPRDTMGPIGPRDRLGRDNAQISWDE